MADITVVEANVKPDSTARKFDTRQIPGAALLLGDAVCLKDATVGGRTVKRLFAAQCDVLADKGVVGVMVTKAAAAEQRAIVQNGDLITIGGTVVVGTEYVLSAAAGKICPKADLVTGNYYVRIGYGVSVTQIKVDILDTGLLMP